MGASMGAVAEKYGRQFGFIWKTAMVILGMSSIYFLIQPAGLYKVWYSRYPAYHYVLFTQNQTGGYVRGDLLGVAKL